LAKRLAPTRRITEGAFAVSGALTADMAVKAPATEKAPLKTEETSWLGGESGQTALRPGQSGHPAGTGEGVPARGLGLVAALMQQRPAG
jgi:hypothetical protein